MCTHTLCNSLSTPTIWSYTLWQYQFTIKSSYGRFLLPVSFHFCLMVVHGCHLHCSLQNVPLLPILLIHWKVNWRMTNNDRSSARRYVLAPTNVQHVSLLHKRPCQTAAWILRTLFELRNCTLNYLKLWHICFGAFLHLWIYFPFVSRKE